MVNHLLQSGRPRFDPQVRKIPEGMAAQYSCLEIPWREDPGGLWSWSLQKSQTPTEQLSWINGVIFILSMANYMCWLNIWILRLETEN